VKRLGFAALLAAAARRRPEHPALTWEGGALSWRELEARAGGVARSLARNGVGPGDVVALLLPNAWGFVAALWGGLALGATVAPLNPLLARDELLAANSALRASSSVAEVAGFSLAGALVQALTVRVPTDNSMLTL